MYWRVIDEANRKAAIVGCTTTKDSVRVSVPDTLYNNGKCYKVTEIGSDAFYNQKQIVDVDLSKYLTKIDEYAFEDCQNIERVMLNSIDEPGSFYGTYTLEEIGDYAFLNCTKMSSIMTSSVKKIGMGAFGNCKSLTAIFGNNLTSIGINAFANCYSLHQVMMGSSKLTEIPNYAFRSCGKNSKNDFTISLPETLTNIARGAFYNVNKMRDIYIPNVKSIGQSAFENCSGLKTVLTTSALSSIDKQAFYGCDDMTYFVCKNTNVSIGEKAIGYTSKSQSPTPNFTIWGTTYNCNAKKYADNNRITYRKTSEAAALASERYTDYEWTYANSSSYWGDYGKYYFNQTHRPYENGYLNQKFVDVSAGMATVSALTSSGYLSVSDYAPGYDTLGSVRNKYGYIPMNTMSYVNTVFANSSSRNRIYNYDSLSRIDKEMMAYAEYITYGADAATFTIRPYDSPESGHTMVCFGIEFKADASDKNDACWNGWDARLLIYDPNRPKIYGPKQNAAHSKDDYVYVRLSDGRWESKLASKYCKGVEHQSIQLSLTHSYSKMVSTSNYKMTADEFFTVIKNR